MPAAMSFVTTGTSSNPSSSGRPSVTTALGQLTERGEIERRSDGGWQGRAEGGWQGRGEGGWQGRGMEGRSFGGFGGFRGGGGFRR